MISSSRSSGRGDIDDRVVRPLAADRERAATRVSLSSGQRDGRLSPVSTSTPDAPERRADPRELARVEPAELGLAARRREPGPLVGEAQRERDRRRVRVGVDQTDVPAAAGELDGELDRDRRAAGRARRSPHRRSSRGSRSAPSAPAASATARCRGERLGERHGSMSQRQRPLEPERRGEPLASAASRTAGRSACPPDRTARRRRRSASSRPTSSTTASASASAAQHALRLGARASRRRRRARERMPRPPRRPRAPRVEPVGQRRPRRVDRDDDLHGAGPRRRARPRAPIRPPSRRAWRRHPLGG